MFYSRIFLVTWLKDSMFFLLYYLGTFLSFLKTDDFMGTGIHLLKNDKKSNAYKTYM